MNKTTKYVISVLGITALSASAQTSFSNLEIDFDEYAFAAGSVTSGAGYNIIDDAAGTILGSNNGDDNDIFISVNTTVPGNASGAHASAEFTGSGLRSNHGFSKTFANTYSSPTANNPGTLIKQTIRVTFASHLSITGFSADFTSLNTRGRTWEHTEIAMLDPSGNYFSAAPSLGDYNTFNTAAPGWNIGSEANGGSGSPSTGWFVAATTDTVQNVGTDLSTPGSSNGSKENLTSTNGNSFLDYNDVGLASGTQVGGIEWTVYLYDTRGQNNNQSNWTVTQDNFIISGTTTPEPSSAILLGLGGLTLLSRRSRKA